MSVRKYWRLVTSPLDNPDYCYIGKVLHADTCELAISEGETVTGEYPADPFTVEAHFSAASGLQLPSLIGNGMSLVALHRDVVKIFAKELDLGEHEVLPFTLVNHKGRAHSKDYVFLNPVGTHDVASPLSKFMRFADGEIYGCEHWVLSAKKVVDAPDLLRPAEVANEYLVSDRLVALVERHALTNFKLEPADLVT